jgi:hypothetical protein
MPREMRVLAGALAGLLAACAGPQVGDYAAQGPALDIREYFQGPVRAYGMVTDRSGRVTRRFTVRMDCRWTGDEGVLDESFVYNDGSTQHRSWRMKRQADGRFVGRADDVVGVAQGEQGGFAFHMQYTLAVPVEGRTWNLQFDDWMYRIDEHSVINRAVMSKFGLRVGEVAVLFTRE